MPKKKNSYLAAAVTATQASEAFQEALKEISRKATSGIFVGTGRGSGKTSATAMAGLSPLVHRWPPMARPACPWPYGTILRPTAANTPSSAGLYMFVGPNGDDTFATIRLDGPYRLGALYTHLRENMHELWEEVPD